MKIKHNDAQSSSKYLLIIAIIFSILAVTSQSVLNNFTILPTSALANPISLHFNISSTNIGNRQLTIFYNTNSFIFISCSESIYNPNTNFYDNLNPSLTYDRKIFVLWNNNKTNENSTIQGQCNFRQSAYYSSS